MNRRLLLTTFLVTFLVGTLGLLFEVQIVEASGIIYIRADGSIDPSTAPIQRNGDCYALTENISVNTITGIVIERGNIVVDGVGYTLDGGGTARFGLEITDVNNVSIKNIRMTSFDAGIVLSGSSNNSVSGISISTCDNGIQLVSSSGNSLSGNNIATSSVGIYQFYPCNYSRISGNNITGTCESGICIGGSYNIIYGNNITNSGIGISVGFPSKNNSIFHNNFINNTQQVAYTSDLVNIWDDGSEGNYWSDYAGTDSNQDGIGDAPYVISEKNADHYPLMVHYVIPEFPSFLLVALFMVGTPMAFLAYKKKKE